MNLPPTLLQRLRQRGLLLKDNDLLHNPDELEEIIAENYDEDEKVHHQIRNEFVETKKLSEEHLWPDRMKERIGVAESYHGYKFCPNKYNIWHKCTLYCVNRWPIDRQKPNENYLRRYKRLLRKYPLDERWKQIYEPGCDCYYFYNPISHKVSWLPPSHPKARVSKSAAIFRRQLANSNDEYNFNSSDYLTSKATDFFPKNDVALETATSDRPSFFVLGRKQKARDLERALLRKRRNDKQL
ncbi:uncharacterized protein LOC115630041 [Scaptodrosophila lebanonensis]|uniref:Uncharacterized protein LOC115630041 n=1 Tax=Drosophila lebanonensis TaxID=7225 RepID=A0A6J2U2C2_DROLE|nr:uncharacterized protein LOC115630041 [Scaptodrosophila lebanonensis]